MSKRKTLLTSNYKSNSYNKEEHTLIERKSLIKLIYNPIYKIKSLTPEILNKVYQKYPVYREIISVVSDFRTLLKDKCLKKLDAWLNRALSLNIGEINSFINGINRDINAVKNAIIYDYNNGLTEGSVNKLKVIKRIMYGRCSFDLLRSNNHSLLKRART
ncbi:transposase [Clostridium sp.]|uniref:transposase n=1 Tax=Clostridium sp. TaxID=1506 RepID=UPI0028414A57|nr:transposase [Clostridium sp.]MDR3594770.1 transposase [Clostridium sp.]